MTQVIASTYEIIEELGSGGGGIVYLANHLRLHKKVILKADRRKVVYNTDRFRREVDILKQLSHTYIPQVYDYFLDQDTAITVIDYIEGESLDKPLKEGERFSQPQVIKWAVQLLEALDYLHSPIHGNPPRGYVHSDIKPANIMRRPNGDICLIDFNIALALGEETAIGRSEGYSSPEHYGLDFSSGTVQKSGETVTEEATVTQSDSVTLTAPAQTGNVSSLAKRVVPDVRSDIYSLGATLYHLLGGKRPVRDAQDVEPLSKQEFSPQLVDIISKAMEPNPDLRYQSAAEMLNAIMGLWTNDARVKRQKRRMVTVSAVCALLFSLGILSVFTGLKRMQTREQWMNLAKESEALLESGDRVQAVDHAKQALNKTSQMFQPEYLPEAQKALTDALGVYQLADGFESYRTVELPEKPTFMELSPDGTSAVCLCADNFVLVDTEEGEVFASLPAEPSALSEAAYVEDHIVIYAGAEGITAYDLLARETLWTGEAATAVRISGDGSRVVGVYKDQPYATEYDTLTGSVVGVFDFGGLHQYVPVNDQFENADQSLYYNMLALNEDGNLLGVSFSTGELQILNLQNPEDAIILTEPEDGFTHFEGGFYKQYFACSVSNGEQSECVVVDTLKVALTVEMPVYSTLYRVRTYDWGICIKQQNKTIRLDPLTGQQYPMVNMDENILRFASNGKQTLTGTRNYYAFFDEEANETGRFKYEYGADFLLINDRKAVVGSRNAASMQILNYVCFPEKEELRFDPQYNLPEARISRHDKTYMLFSNSVVVILDFQGNLLKQITVPDPGQVYDQQFRRDAEGAYLEITYYDGHIVRYGAADGSILSDEYIDPPDKSLYEALETDGYRVESSLHGAPEVYRKDTGQFIADLKEEAFLTYITETGEYLIAQYITYDQSRNYGILMNKDCEVLAELPYLCDIEGNTLYFKYPSGYIRSSEIYDLEQLFALEKE